MWKKSVQYVIALVLIALVGCSSAKDPYSIGIDPTWYPLRLMGRESNVSAFTVELLREISRVEKIQFKQITRSWDNLLTCLEEGRCQAVISSLYPHLFHLDRYQFSEVFLETGPVLIVRNGQTLEMLDQLEGKEVAVDSQAHKALLIQLFPGAVVRSYTAIPEALNELSRGKFDAVLADVIPARAFVENLYAGKLTMASEPLTRQGLRVITAHPDQCKLLEHFNAGLKKLTANGTYARLLEKWNLTAKKS